MVGAFLITQQVSPYTHFTFITVAACVMVFLAYRNTIQVETETNDNQPLFVKPDRELLLLGLIGFCSMVCEGAMFDWSGVYFQNAVQVPAEKATLGYVAFMATMAGGRFTADWLVNKIGKKKLLQISGILIGTGLMISVLFPYLVSATLGFLLVGFGVSSVVPLVYSAAGKSTTMTPGMALAAVSSISFLGFLIGPPLIGHIAEIANIRWAFATVAVLGSCTTLLVMKAKLIK
jgi:MFS family permease